METNLTAATIVNQIGPGALMRVGAHTFMHDGDALIFHTGRGHRSTIIVTLSRATDTYSVKTLKIKRDLSILERHIADGVYADQLSQIIADLG